MRLLGMTVFSGWMLATSTGCSMLSAAANPKMI
jgi:hypothetical protein